MAIPTQFSVTSTRTSPIANPLPAKDIPQSADAENVAIISGPNAFDSLLSSGINAPVAATSESAASIDTPTVATSETSAVTPAPTAASAQASAVIGNAVVLPAESIASTPTPSTLNVEASATISTPSAATSQAAVNTPTPSTATSQAPTNTPTPSAASAESVAPLATPSAATSEAATSTPAPTTLTATSGTATAPPFALNHARILSSNKLLGYDSVSSDVGGSAINALKENTWEKWRPSGDGYFKVVLASDQDIDTICIGAHNFGTENLTVNPQYRATIGGALQQFAASKVITSDNAIMFHRSSSLSVRVIEIYISGGASSAEAGYISAGLALQMQRPFFNGHTPITDADVTQYYSNRTESGEIIGQQIRRQGYETSVEWQNIDDTWYRTYFAPFKQAIKTKPFFFAWNLLEYPDDVGFVRIAQDISAPMQNGTVTKRSISMNLLGAG